MSDNWIILIPTAPDYIPTAPAQQESLALFASFVPAADEVNAIISPGVEFVDQGANWERVCCPICGTELDLAWWENAMDQASLGAYESGLDEVPDSTRSVACTNLMVSVPCCGSTVSLNDLIYQWPAGFSRFSLEARNPSVPETSGEQIAALENILNCELRQIWAHY